MVFAAEALFAKGSIKVCDALMQPNRDSKKKFEKCITSDEVVFAQGFFVGV